MRQSELGQSSDNYGFLLGVLSVIGLVVGVLYLWLFKRPAGEAFYVLPLAVLMTIAIFALFILIIHFWERP
ncbi:MAG: hypothetical protein H6667_03980 [Ardenticatenaceae bacterium]|nr:hypothetical protein [Ardenticatenaceae bacterium]MCB9446633.1 hypothetical protein [Ardenticatenaceae bacterium]